MSDMLAIKSLSGEEKTINSKLPWGKEKQVLKIIGSMIAKAPFDFLGLQGGGFNLPPESEEAPGVAFLKYVTTEAPDQISTIVSIILEIPVEEVENNFDGDAVFDFVIPFISTYMTKWQQRLQGMPLGPTAVEAPPSAIQ